MTNGGTDGFYSVPAADVDAQNSPYSLIATASIMGTPAAEGIVLQVLADVIQLGREGMTQLVTPGLVGVFNTTPAPTFPFEGYKFPSQVTFGWQPPSGLVINQIRFPEVFAKRPNGLSISPRGDRALVSYFQTGNFGVLDLGAQRRFGRPDAQQTDAFSGVAGVTPALPLDVHLWPKRGAFDSPDGTRVPTPDESLLSPGPIRCARAERQLRRGRAHGDKTAANLFCRDSGLHDEPRRALRVERPRLLDRPRRHVRNGP